MVLKDTKAVQRIYDSYKGLTITFPKKLYSKEFVQKYILENYKKESVQQMARELDLSERRVRQLLKDMKKKEE